MSKKRDTKAMKIAKRDRLARIAAAEANNQPKVRGQKKVVEHPPKQSTVTPEERLVYWRKRASSTMRLPWNHFRGEIVRDAVQGISHSGAFMDDINAALDVLDKAMFDVLDKVMQSRLKTKEEIAKSGQVISNEKDASIPSGEITPSEK